MKTIKLVRVIAEQAKYLKTENVELLYNEITDFLVDNKLNEFALVDEIKYPQKILKSDNFQYLIDGTSLTVKNKFFK